MSEEENESNKGGGNNVNASIDAVTGLVKAVPIYDDAVQPVAKQIGKSLETVGKLVNVALAPVGLLVWGYDQFEDFIKTKVADRLKDVPPEDIITPKANVAGPAIEALRYTGHEESLSDMYANLLASAMNKSTADGAHPAFVEIIKQMTPDEAKLMSLFLERRPFPIVSIRAEVKEDNSGITFVRNLSLFGDEANLEVKVFVPSYLDNLSRLGLISIHSGESYTDPGMYDELEGSELVKKRYAEAAALPERVPRLVRGFIRLTNLGVQFGVICVKAQHIEGSIKKGLI
ncbi:DUF4393 domain-containing protein [Pseudomonas syringae]|uniref:DUF4393 domain-containing protein n=1 Tax=Pseudomonas syringae TaxID=317 RepID=UPI000463D5A1|nr:DUF4393 domain-containing protein [Pseudomonas syringae]UOF21936.1 DUF4393 domain-containing protein [Pseudomonas syringae CC440]